MSLLYMPHFGRTSKVNTCVNKPLVFFHGGFLWLDIHISVDVYLIATITGFPIVGIDPIPYIARKDQDKILVAQMKQNYIIMKDKRGFDIASIND